MVVPLISALFGAFVWTGWVRAEYGLGTFVAIVLVVVAAGLLAGFQVARREGRKGAGDWPAAAHANGGSR